MVDVYQDESLTPEPHSPLDLTVFSLPTQSLLVRIHSDRYGATQFNPGTAGNARFSPILDPQGNPIPTLYAATSNHAAMMETIFHDVPYGPGIKRVSMAKLHGQVHSSIVTKAPLNLVKLTSVSLRKLGVTRKQLIETNKDQYPSTRAWAEAIYAQDPSAQGLYWVSRQDDTAFALMLFGDRIPEGILDQAEHIHSVTINDQKIFMPNRVLTGTGQSKSLIDDKQILDDVLDLAEMIGVSLM